MGDYNRPRSIYQYSNMAPRVLFSRQPPIHGVVVGGGGEVQVPFGN